jgi:MFS family permease
MAGGQWRDRWLGPLNERDFRRYFAGQVTSQVGTGMLPVALSFAVLRQGGSVADVGYVIGAETLPLVLLLLVAGVLADRTSRRLVMMGADVARAAAQAALAAWILLGHPPLWGFIGLECVVGAGNAIFTPAMTGLIPEVASAEHLQQANVLNGSARWTGFLIGPAVAGVLVAVSGPGWAVAVDAASYVVSAACLSTLRGVRSSGAETGGEPFVTQLRQGWSAFRSRTWLWSVVAQFSLFGLVVFPAFYVLGAVVAARSLGGAAAWGAILATFGAGAVVGGLSMLWLRPSRPLLAGELAMLTWVLVLGALALRAPTVVVALCALVAGTSFGIFGPLWDTTMQRELPPEVLSRASAYDWFGSFVFLPLGYALEGVFAHLLGVSGALWLGASWLALSTVAVLCLPSVTGLRAPGRTGPSAATTAPAGVRSVSGAG